MSAAGPPALTVPLCGWQVIEASAGTGKTWTITALIARALVEHDCSADRILVMTYTRAATAELRARVRARLGALAAALRGVPVDDGFVQLYLPRIHDRTAAERRVRAALASIDEFPIQTVHGFCQRVQAQFGLAWGQSEAPSITTDTGRHLRRAALQYWNELIGMRQDGRAWLAELLVLLDLDPDRLQSLLRQALSHPAAAARPEPIDLAEVARRFVGLREWAQALWRRDGASYVAAIGAEKRLPATYRRHLSTWSRKIEAYFASERALPGNDGQAWTALAEDGLTAHLDADAIAALHPELPAALRALFQAAAELGGFDLRLARAFRDWAPERIERYKREAGEQEHDDAVRALWRALADDPGLAVALRRRFAMCFVDEGQDTDALQWGILSRIYPRDATDTALFYVGDPKQAIYRFRGADVFTYLSVTRQVASIARLTENRRSTPQLVAAVNALFERRGAFAVDEIRFLPASAAPVVAHEMVEDGALDAAPFRWVWLDPQDRANEDGAPAQRASNKSVTDELAAASCAAEIARLLASARARRIGFRRRAGQAEAAPSSDASAGAMPGGRAASLDAGESASCTLHPRDVAVLVNTHRQATLVRRALQRHGIGAAERARDSVLASVEAEELQRVIAAIVDPSDSRLVRGAWATRLLGADPESLARSLDDAGLMRTWTEPVLAAQQRWRRDGPLPALRELAASAGVARQLAGRTDGARAWTNLLHLTEMLHQASPPVRSPQAAMAWFEQSREHAGEAFELRLETDTDLVQIVTVHRSKGLEYPVVFVPFAWSGRAADSGSIALDHDPDRQWVPVLDFCSPREPSVQARARTEGLAEVIRQLYVALTRAEHRCYLFWGAAKGAEHTALAWLLHGADEPARALALPEHDRMRGALEAHVARCAGAATVVDAQQLLAQAPARVADLDAAAARPLAARALRHPVRRAWRVLSYSALVRAGVAGAGVAGTEEPDHDQHEPHQVRPASTAAELAVRDPARGPAPALPGEAPGARATGGGGRWTETAELRSGFPRGAEAGQCLHELLEQIDFEQPVDAGRCAEVLARYGISVARAPGVAAWLDDVLDAPLRGEGLPPVRLREVQRTRRLSEFGFDMSLPAARLDGFRQALGATLPADAAAAHFATGAPAAMLRGFVDLVFEHSGRFHIVDWKSNWLGPTTESYCGERLVQAMRDASYELQYLLYVVALHRWLARRVPGYRYETHFGGVWYLFLRGVSARHPDAGVFHARPAIGLIETVDAALSAGPAR